MVFGKNSARPRDEVQEVVYFPAADHEPESKVEVSDAWQSLDGHPILSLALPSTPSLLRGGLLTRPSCRVGSAESHFHWVCL